MSRTTRTLVLLIALAFISLSCVACGSSRRTPAVSSSLPATPPAAPLPADATDITIRFLEDRVKRDPDDFPSLNKLAGYYLQQMQETGDIKYLELASRTAQASLKAMPAEQNPGALGLLARSEYTSHNFAGARDLASRLIQIDPHKSYPYEILGDALFELGDYEQAEDAYRQMQSLSGPGLNVASEMRFAKLDVLHGHLNDAGKHFQNALALELNQAPPSREVVAWCRWQLGEIAFAGGDYERAERYDRDALVTFPDYYRALAALGRVRAARGDLAGAIEQYERVVRRLPDPTFIAALGDLYKLSGRDTDAASQYQLVEQIARLSALNGVLYNRQLALFDADHDVKPEEAVAQATKEYEARRDIYGADAVAWAALKAGKLDVAQRFIKEALRFGTRDARLWYHAGLIARAAGDNVAARDYLQRALTLNPQFDPLQATIARKLPAE